MSDPAHPTSEAATPGKTDEAGATRRLFEPARLGPLTLRNRVIKAATFEGRSPDGLVTDDLIEFHAEVAAGGAAMSTVAYLSVAPEGRTDAGCILLVPDALAGLRRLTDAIHDRGALAQAQIGHAGPVANASSNKARSLAPGRMLNPLGMRFTKAADEGDIARVTSDYERGAKLCVDAGFDSLEVHLGHNYLLSSFLSPKFNQRNDRWGGSIENRARFARQVVTTVRAAAGSDVAVTAKLNMTDGYRGGLSIEDSLEVAALLESDGALDAIELTGGSSLANPMYLFKGAAPTREFGATLPWYLRGGFRMVGDKAVALIAFLPGGSVSHRTPDQAHAVGRALAQMHLASADFAGSRANAMNLPESRRLAEACGHDGMASIDPALAALVTRELPLLESSWPADLPRAVIHADLFPDNVLMLGSTVTGLIDFYFACTDLAAYDVAVTHAAWCFDAQGGNFSPAISAALLEGYEALRPLSTDERVALPVLARAAALRFTMSRAFDWLNTPVDALVVRKSPMAFARRLEFYADPANVGVYAQP